MTSPDLEAEYFPPHKTGSAPHYAESNPYGTTRQLGDFARPTDSDPDHSPQQMSG